LITSSIESVTQCSSIGLSEPWPEQGRSTRSRHIPLAPEGALGRADDP
jgi:hypothetical protein